MEASCHRTLIVEDNPVSRIALDKLLHMMGQETVTATTVAEGLQKLSARPDCLILDLMLPDGNGVEILERVRLEGRPIRVAVVSGAHDPALLSHVRELKPDGIFPKPLNFQQLARWFDEAEALQTPETSFAEREVHPEVDLERKTVTLRVTADLTRLSEVEFAAVVERAMSLREHWERLGYVVRY